MSLLSVKGLTQEFDGKLLYEDAAFDINAREHVGIVGFNGAGKTTFVNIITGRITHDSGEVHWQGGTRFGYLDQHADIDRNQTVMEYLSSSFKHLKETNAKLEKIYEDIANTTDDDEMQRLIDKSATLQDRLLDGGFYEMDATIKKVANGLGVGAIGYETPIAQLSGGQRAKVMLSRLLLEDYDIIMLDEPTNFLDLEHVEWLAKYLETYKGTFLLVSHDTRFLNRVCNFILSIENKEIKKYPGNYDAFALAHANNQKQYEEAYVRQQREIKKMQDYIDRNKARAATAGMANARKKMLERIDVLHKPVAVLPAEFRFECNAILTKDMLIAKGLEIGYGTALLPPIDLHLAGNTKLWIRGTNGIGKTTLVKTLLGKIVKMGGSFRFNPNAKIGYLEQDLEFRNINGSAADFLSDAFPRMNQKDLRTALAAVGLKGELAMKPIENLSGGEQVRAKIAALERKETNILILDEPTNHLDVLAKEALVKALNEYDGAIILVSHEVEFAEQVTTSVFDVEKIKK